MAAIAYIANGNEYFEIPLGTGVFIRVSSYPIEFQSPVGYLDSRDGIIELETVDDDNISDEDDEAFDDEIEDEITEEDD